MTLVSPFMGMLLHAEIAGTVTPCACA